MLFDVAAIYNVKAVALAIGAISTFIFETRIVNTLGVPCDI